MAKVEGEQSDKNPVAPSQQDTAEVARAARARGWLLPAAGLGGVLAVFAVVVAAVTLSLRERLRSQALQQEASSLESMVMLQLDSQAGSLSGADLADSTAGTFGAVLDSSRLRGVIAVRLYDGKDELKACLPATAVDAARSPDLVRRARDLGKAAAELHENARLEDWLGTEGLVAGEKREPLLEVVVPVPVGADGGLSVAHFWMDGAPMFAAFRAMDRGLAWQAGFAFVAGSLAAALCLSWVYRRLVVAERVAEDRAADLARANAELDFAARTSAIGAISAHLLHGLKNPVAGIDGFLADAADAESVADGEALREARETTRRITTLLRDVSAVLREEGAGAAGEPAPLSETVNALAAAERVRAEDAGVRLVLTLAADPELEPRVASLCRLALQNLLVNAVEATPRGRRVEIRSLRLAADRVAVDVLDEGGGFDERARASLFQPKRSSKPGGSGLGLAISHQLARHAGGTLALAQTGPGGSRFRLEIPARHFRTT